MFSFFPIPLGTLGLSGRTGSLASPSFRIRSLSAYRQVGININLEYNIVRVERHRSWLCTASVSTVVAISTLCRRAIVTADDDDASLALLN